MAWRFIRRDHAPRDYTFAYHSQAYTDLRSFRHAVLNYGVRCNPQTGTWTWMGPWLARWEGNP